MEFGKGVNMTNSQKYDEIFIKTFNVSYNQLIDLKYQGVDTWDSVGHMGLIAALEDEFQIMFEADDIVDFSSYAKGKSILKKYDINL